MDIVSAIRDRVLDEIGEDRFDLWFGSVQLRYRHDTLTVAAASSFLVERIRTQFSSLLRSAAATITGHVIAIQFQVDQTLASDSADRSPPRAASSAAAVVKDADTPAAEKTWRRKFASLSSFAVGETNRIAFTAAASIAQRLGAVTPLVLHGPTGCGKTHLLEGIWSATRKATRRRRLVMLSAEQFTSYFLDALQGSGLPSFRRKYREVDLLIIDDVQFFSGKRATLVELQHTIDALLREGRQVVLGADRPPAELYGLGAELVARMTGGLICGIEPADEQTRLAILRRLATIRKMSLPDSVLHLIASEMLGDARQLSGALNRLQAASEALRQPITVELAASALTDIFQQGRRSVQMPDIEKAICEVFGLDSNALQSDKKSNAVSHPRMLAMWLARRYTRAAYAEIGQYFGKRSHSTVISAQKKVKNWVDDGAQIRLAGGSDCCVSDAIKRIELRLRTG